MWIHNFSDLENKTDRVHCEIIVLFVCFSLTLFDGDFVINLFDKENANIVIICGEGVGGVELNTSV